MLLLLAQLPMMKIRVGDGWTVVCSKKRQNMKNLKEKKDFGEGGLFNRSKEKGGPKRKGSKKDEGVFKSGSLRSDSKIESFQEAPFLSLRCSGPIPDISGFPVVAGVFDVSSRADLPASVLCTSGTALPKVNLESEVVIAGSQVEQEERVTGDTPPARLGCAVPVVENDLLRASKVKFDSLSSGADTCLRMQPKAFSGCAGGSRCGSAGVVGRRALRSSRRSQALVSSSDRRVASQSQVDDKFADNFVPYRRVISCDSDLDSLHLFAPSVSGSSVSLRSVSRVSGCCGACAGEGGARCGVRSEHVGDCVNLEGDLSGHNSWKHGHETAGGTKMLTQSSGFKDGCSFVDTALGGATLEQCLRGTPKGTKVEAWEGRIFTCSRPASWDVSVAEGCKVTVSAVYLPKKRPGPPAAGAVQPCCRCSYSYGNGPAVGPQVSGNWEFLRGLWRAVAPLMAPWCADGEMPTCANLNLYGGSGSRVRWHSDNEGVFGKQGESKLIVSMSFGVSALFKWKPRPSLDSDASSSWLHHGDLLVMDGRCQDEYYAPGNQFERFGGFLELISRFEFEFCRRENYYF